MQYSISIVRSSPFLGKHTMKHLLLFYWSKWVILCVCFRGCFIQLSSPNGSLISSLIDYLHSRMSSFFHLVPFLLGLHATTNGAPTSNPKGKETTCYLPQQNETLYKISSINADFAFNLYRKFSVDTPNQNIFFSPVSISAALAMLSFGVGSSTQTQILEVLGFNLTNTSMADIQEDF